MTTDVRSSVDWEFLAANLKPTRRSVLISNSPSSSSLFSEVSYPHPWREFKLLKREMVYNFDSMKLKIRCLGEYKVSMILRFLGGFFWNDVRAVCLKSYFNEIEIKVFIYLF